MTEVKDGFKCTLSAHTHLQQPALAFCENITTEFRRQSKTCGKLQAFPLASHEQFLKDVHFHNTVQVLVLISDKAHDTRTL